MALYTRTGDSGTTQLGDGSRRIKSDVRVEAYGQIDSVTAVMMWCRARAVAYVQLGDGHDSTQETSLLMFADRLQHMARRTFIMGTMVSNPTADDTDDITTQITKEDIAQLEVWIDEYTAQAPQLRAFILPGSSELATRLHVARTSARTAERSIVALHAIEPISDLVLAYINRLSDLLFAMARYADVLLGQEDVLVRNPNAEKSVLTSSDHAIPEVVGGL